MKIHNRYIVYSACLFALLLGATSCKRLLNINQNPNYPTLAQGTPAQVFPVAVLATAGSVGGNLAILGGMWSQIFTQASLSQQYTEVDSYNLTSTDVFVQGPWDQMFVDGLKNFQYVIAQADSVQDWNSYLMGTVMKAYTAATLVDLYGSTPYSNALEGITNLDPKFDSGYAIYTSLIAEIDTAQGKDFSANTNTNMGSQDLIFGGNMSSWQAFANTLKLKLYLRMVNAYPSVAQAGITALINSGVPLIGTSTGDASVTNFSNAPGQDNPLYEQNVRELNTPTNLRASVTMVSWLYANNDPRVNAYYGSTWGTPVLAIDQGNFRIISNTYGNANVFTETAKDPVEFVSMADSYFMQAEAAVRYYGGTNAQSLYNQGVTVAFGYTGYPSDTAAAFLATGGPYAWGAEMEGGKLLTPLAQIIRQKWAASGYGCHGIESYFDFNRTGFPAKSAVYSTSASYVPGQLVVVANSVLGSGLMPKRLIYPFDEQSRNTNALPTVPITTPVWWGL
ncbi:SusD/RagB family nutrient-binding outer membrane lipoprotein [Dinghuibacter silviterrae]|uniref:SusD-like starch-binding protein associating with outer membrane n=1 Tax=Dinghuibacter silviterrae TaxID=1539049 RepID=A0A4R8DF63_9BACT|nr:SusD/RagB family nutrient-binding outer membrane lipoprotein [Dinghuibacter silviterrae]TDW95716.1 SusD-like starch-binding protein associating with outer membrane [Dinghuibacter silviterrae]